MQDAFRRFLTLIAVLLLAAGVFYAWRGAGGGYGVFDFLRGRGAADTRPVSVTTATGPQIDLSDVKVLAELNREYTALMDVVRPSVVSLNTTRHFQIPRLRINRFGFLTRSYDWAEQPGLGSGSIVSEEGHVLTNFHVIANVDQIEVTTSDGSVYPAEVIGAEESADIAVLQIKAPAGTRFTAIPFGDSEAVHVGEIVFAIGNPFGLGETVTQGIISARPRQVRDGILDMFQTDTVINPGNSGGPLVNIRGELIGMNTAIYTSQESVRAWQGAGFAIPSRVLDQAFASIMNTGRSLKGYLGIHVEEIDPRVKHDIGIRDGSGVRLVEVSDGSPADAAGLESGDIIIQFDGNPVRSTSELIEMIGVAEVGERVELLVLRDHKPLKLTATIDDVSKYVTASKAPPEDSARAAQKISQVLGLSVENLSSLRRRRLGFRPDWPGIEVTGVSAGSPLARKLRPEDIIFAVNDTPVHSIVQFYDEVDMLPFDQPSVLRYLRDGQPNYVEFVPRRAALNE